MVSTHESLSDLSNGTREELVIFLDKVEHCGKWPQQTCTTLFFLRPRIMSRASGPLLLLPSLFRWELLRAPEVGRWKGRHRVKWGATDVRNGGAERTS